MAACYYVQFLDVDSVEDQKTDAALRQERCMAEAALIYAVAALQQERGA
jgi:hypothetical protein